MKKITLLIICLSIISLPFIIADNEQESKLVRMTQEQVAEKQISQDQIVKRVGQDYLIREER